MKEFLKDNLNNPKSEFYIPLVVNKLLEEKKAICKVLTTESEWFGVTYAGDKPKVMAQLQSLADAGVYPTPLWK